MGQSSPTVRQSKARRLGGGAGFFCYLQEGGGSSYYNDWLACLVNSGLLFIQQNIVGTCSPNMLLLTHCYSTSWPISPATVSRNQTQLVWLCKTK